MSNLYKDNLEKAITELREIEPFWNRCFPCKHKGKCCIGADIEVSESEWNTIFKFVQSMSNQDKEALKNNIISKKHCVFHTENECLIHEVRPENCRYTPFQFTIDNNNILKYYTVSDTCEFYEQTIELSEETVKQIISYKFVKVPVSDEYVHYLSLNYLAQYDTVHQKYYKVSNLLENLFHVI